jgi:Na+/melibiose symporter-like transporter
VTISLAGSLFFSISPKAAEGHVLLYLLLTIAPFAIVGPALSPLLDRGRRTRRGAVAIAAIASAVACFGMARNISDLWLFPEAFAILVLSKLYGVARAAIVPELTETGEDLAGLNARLAVIASIAGFVVIPIGVLVLKIGAPWVLRVAAVFFVAEAVAAFRLPHSNPDPEQVATQIKGRRTSEPARARYAEVADARRLLGLPLQPHLVSSSLRAVSAMRATVGFVEFFLAFSLRRAHAASWWFGVLILASGVGSLIGSAVVPRLRRRLGERQIIAVALWSTVVGALLAGLIGGRLAQCMLCFVVGAAPMAAKPALDSIVQRNIAPALLARMFGRLETRLQLLWVLAALAGVVIPFPLRVGDGVVAITGLVAGVSFASRAGPQKGDRGGRSRKVAL